MEKAKTRSAKKITDTVKKIVGMGEDKPAAVKKAADQKAMSQEELNRRIQDKAYELYLKRGSVAGDSQKDWLEAERIVKAELGRN